MSTSIDPARLRPSRIWRRLSDEGRRTAALAFWTDTESRDEQTQAINAIALQKKFRPKSVATLPVERKVQFLASLPNLSEPLAARALVAYHLQAQRPMMSAFLDALGIRHEDGAIADEEMTPPDGARLGEAASRLARDFPREDVAIYLSTLVCQDPMAWAGLVECPEIDG
ncbi:MAG TPA: hypothetical protein VND92_04060 [Vicinamibacterales bacterium]|nr:hypothetical protein [Vicinamibacterales bacterium]